MEDKILLSVVIPTRDRPDCLYNCLKSISTQELENIEVVVSDNGITKSCDEVVKSFSNSNFNYVHTDKNYSLKGSFEFAVGCAKGDWVLTLNDKNLLYRDALKKIIDVILRYSPDIVNYPTDFFIPFDFEESITQGKLQRLQRTHTIIKVDQEEALRNHFSCNYLLQDLGEYFPVGSILGGAYSRKLIDKMKHSHTSGLLFDGGVPDRYAAIEALYIADIAYYLDDSVVIYDVCNKNTWNYDNVKERKDIFAKFESERDGEKNCDKLIIPEVFTSLSNILATDYLMAQEHILKLYGSKYGGITLNIGCLVASVENEVNRAKVSDEVKREEIKYLERYKSNLRRNELKNYNKKKREIDESYRKLNSWKASFKRQIADIDRKLIYSDSKAISNIAFSIMQKCSTGNIITKDIFEVL